MMLQPLRSVMSVQHVEETSLALPSDSKLRSAQQRVLEQVHTVRRSRSRGGGSASGPVSPTSPISFSSKSFSDNVFSRNTSGRFSSFIRETQGMNRRQVRSYSQYEKPSYGISTVDGPSLVYFNKLKSSSSNPELVTTSAPQRPALHFLPTQSSGCGTRPLVSSQPNFDRAPSSYSNTNIKISTSKPKNGGDVVENGTNITMNEAVEFLSRHNENYQNLGVSFIQHSTFHDDKAKQEVLQLKGIPRLVALLQSTNPQIQQTASGALRNLVFKNNDNKLEVQRCGGIEEALVLLKKTDCPETQKHVTGLLWNLSSTDELKSQLLRSAIPVLTESVVMPFAGWPEKISNSSIDPEVFYNTTACLRNLSSAKKGTRQPMRNCHGLIDSLVTYVQTCVAEDRPDDKSVENCVCVLHNLTYQVETEAPALFSKINALAVPPLRSTAQQVPSPIGCFSTQSGKTEQEGYFDYPVMEDNNPKGAGWLFHSSTMQTYLSLLESSQKDATKEACVGALQNLTAHKGTVSGVMSQSIVQKLNGLQNIMPLLQSTNPSLQRTTMALVGNLSRTPRLQSTMARQTLPQLTSLLSSGAKNNSDSDDTITTASYTILNLLKAEPEVAKKLLNNTFVNSLTDLSKNRFLPKSSQAASLLLYSLWAEKDFQSFLKKQGMHKSNFVNDITTSAHKLVQAVQ
ncbi:plakophilin-1-like [Scleropages formosus]|uniref:Plakophilin 1b n=1 Tax=Scleropages formosus TaxID=113540 RepID=A0A8C9R3G9_SCLFO|nr:plakophilin-1-like [Scleropages formosus]